MVNSISKRFWAGKNVLVTGGGGFIGSHVVERLVELKARVTVLDHITDRKKQNLHNIEAECNFLNGDCSDIETARAACAGQEIVLNLAARVRGINYNQNHHTIMFEDNLKITLSMLRAAQEKQVDRFLIVSSACVYPHDALIPTPESEGFRGEPEPSNNGYGWAKRMSEKLGEYYFREFGMKIAIVRPYNAYGPRDHFGSSESHVIPALIKKVLEGENPVVVWGSGRQTRSFLYVTDLAEGMIMAVEKYLMPDPINLGTNEEISIRDLVHQIVKISGKKSEIVFDTTKPDGSPQRQSDNSKAKSLIGFEPVVKLKEGLMRTIKWYQTTNRYE